MFSQFRARYPTGSLIAELLTIYQGKYVVRALVQVEGVMLATGLAAADTPEQAEDLARIRALEILGIALSMSSPSMRYGESLQAPVSEEVQHSSAQASFQRDKEFSSAPVGQTLPSSVQREAPGAFDRPTPTTASPSSVQREIPGAFDRPTPTTAPPSSVDSSPQSAASDDDWLKSDDDSMGWKGGSKFSGDRDLTPRNPPLQTSDATAKPQTADEASAADRLRQNLDFSQPLPFEEPTWNATAFDEPTDLSDAFVQIDDLTSRLGWTPEIERDFFKRTYGKGKIGRSFLDTSEVMEFLDYLEAFAKTTDELNRVGWNPKVERIYLKNAYGREERSHLTYTELLQFLQYLEVFAQTTNEINRLGWNQQQGIDYLLQTYGKKGRSELSYEQLLAFRNYLQSL